MFRLFALTPASSENESRVDCAQLTSKCFSMAANSFSRSRLDATCLEASECDKVHAGITHVDWFHDLRVRRHFPRCR